jgi:hypothetical protein
MTTVSDTFVSTVLSAESLNAATIERSIQVLATLGGLIVLFMSGMGYAYHLDKLQRRIADEKKKKAGEQLHSAGGKAADTRRQAIYQRGQTHEIQNQANSLLKMAEEALPQVLQSQSWSHRIWSEMKKHHRWLGIAYFYSERFPRMMRVLSLVTNIIIMLFIQSLTYDLTKGDDGSCERLSTEQACLEPRSAFATGDSRCYWVKGEVASSSGSCHYIEPDNNLQVVLFVAIFSGLVSIPIAVMANYIIQNVLSVSTATSWKRVDMSKMPASLKERGKLSSSNFTAIVPAPDESESKEGGHIVRGDRQSAFVRPHVYDIKLKEKTEEEYAAMMKDLNEHVNSLADEKERKELIASWALEQDDDKKEERGSLVAAKSDKKKGPDVASLIKDDLLEVEKSLQREIKQAKKCTSETLISKRLLYLFQMDLMAGMTGRIIEGKDKRDNLKSGVVSATAKRLGWLTIVLMNSSMLFYVFLFAVRQDTHRQQAWGRSFGLWLFTEIVFVSSSMAFVMHILLPLLTVPDLKRVQGKLLDSIVRYYESIEEKGARHEAKSGTHEEEEEDSDSDSDEDSGSEDDAEALDRPKRLRKQRHSFNAAKYLYVSYRLAKEFPEIRASKIVLQYETPWPRQSYHYTHNVTKEYGAAKAAVVRSILIVPVYFIGNFLTVPTAIQDMVVEMVSTVTIGYTILLHVQLYYFYPVLVIVPFLFFAGIVHFVLKAWNKQSEIDRMMFLRRIRERFSGKRREEAYIAKDDEVQSPAAMKREQMQPSELDSLSSAVSVEGSLHSHLSLPEYYSHGQLGETDEHDNDVGPTGLHQAVFSPWTAPVGASHITRRASLALGIKLSQTLKSELDSEVFGERLQLPNTAYQSTISEENKSIDSLDWNLGLDSSEDEMDPDSC